MKKWKKEMNSWICKRDRESESGEGEESAKGCGVEREKEYVCVCSVFFFYNQHIFLCMYEILLEADSSHSYINIVICELCFLQEQNGGVQTKKLVITMKVTDLHLAGIMSSVIIVFILQFNFLCMRSVIICFYFVW
jgi:hypothetical protein